jgi:hypothetical protein
MSIVGKTWCYFRFIIISGDFVLLSVSVEFLVLDIRRAIVSDIRSHSGVLQYWISGLVRCSVVSDIMSHQTCCSIRYQVPSGLL